MKKIIFVLMVFAAFSKISAQDYEEFFGQYKSYNSKYSIAFSYNLRGVKNLRINSKAVIDTLITYDTIGKYGNDLYFRIMYDEGDITNIIKILFVSGNRKFIMASGYYMQFTEDDNGNMKVIKNTPLAFKMIKKYSYNEYEK